MESSTVISIFSNLAFPKNNTTLATINIQLTIHKEWTTKNTQKFQKL